MKKFTKITLIISGICIVLGMSLIIGTGVFGDLYYGNMDLNFGPNGMKLREVEEFVDAGEDWLEHELESTLKRDKAHQDIRLAGSEIRELEIAVKAASLDIILDDSIDGIMVEDGSDILDVHHSVKENTLYLEIKKKDEHKSISNVAEAALTLRIPAHMKFDEIDMELNAAELDAERLAAEELSFNLNASSAELHEIESGVLDVENNASAFWMYGVVERELEVDCNAGAVEIELNHGYSEFNYDVNCKVGTVHVSDKEYSGLKSSVTMKNEGAKKVMDLDCNAGEIDVRFDES